MTAKLLDGREVAAVIKARISKQVNAIKAQGLDAPSLAVVLAGNDPASEVYVANKRKACAEVGIISHSYDLPANVSEPALIELIQKLNYDKATDGILVQLPLPIGINTDNIIECIGEKKDVDGFHPYNFGRLALRNPILRPCTPYGIIQLLQAYKIPLPGQHAVVVGASHIVGRPMALEFLMAGATVTVCHRLTKDLKRHIEAADIIIVAAGVQSLMNVQGLKNHQVLIDVGIHRMDANRIRGDVDFDEAREKVAWITPVPGGVGPMTIACLLQNTLIAASLRRDLTMT